MAKLPVSQLKGNPGMVLYCTVFNHEPGVYFSAQDVYNRLIGYGIEDYTVKGIDYMLRQWAYSGRLARRFKRYKVEPERDDVRLYRLMGMCVS